MTAMVGVVLHNRVEKLLRRRMMTPDVVLLPARVTDVETVLDILDVTGKRWVQEQSDSSIDQLEYSFNVTSGPVTREQLPGLSVHERNSLNASVTLGRRTLNIVCSIGHLYVGPEGLSENRVAEREAIRILLQGSSWRPIWPLFLPALPLIPALLLLVGDAWLLATQPINPAVLLAGAGATALLIAVAIKWALRLRARWNRSAGPIRFRAQSRQDLYASRADRLANFKVALITAPVSIAVALFIAWATGFVTPKP